MSGNFTNADLAHLDRALKLASISTCRHKHGAVIAQGRRVLGVGINIFRSDPNNVTNPKTEASFHAEISALRSVRRVEPDYILYVARVRPDGTSALSKPCLYCELSVALTGIKRVVYTTNNEAPGELLLYRIPKNSPGGVLVKTSQKLQGL